MSTHRLLGSALSPFALKVRAACAAASIDARWLPDEGDLRDAWRVAWDRARLVLGLSRPSPPLDPLGELPLVPYLFGPLGETMVDSTVIARALGGGVLRPTAPRARFVCDLIEEALDELGLYLLHHQRWVRSAASTRAVSIAVREFRHFVPEPMRERAGERFAARQVRRLPYLFSVAPAGTRRSDVPEHRQPPSRAGFPPTHALLDAMFVTWTEALDRALVDRPFLFGERPSTADCALFGIVRSHLEVDPETAADLRSRCPHLVRLAEASFGQRDSGAPFTSSGAVEAAAETLASTALPILIANEVAFERAPHTASRNERAFDANICLYDGEVHGHAYRAVAKTFQVPVIRALRASYRALDPGDRAALTSIPAARRAFEAGTTSEGPRAARMPRA